ncbi:MAG: hypothetical protein WDA26_05465 [Pusillimonas sp.]
MNEIKTWKKLTEKSVVIGEKEIPLRYTVHQMQELERVLTAEKVVNNESGKSLSAIAEQDLAICEIALNPEPNFVCMPREDIEVALDLDQIKLLAQYWMQHKVFAPEITKN